MKPSAQQQQPDDEILEENKAYYNRNARRYEAASWYFFNAYKNNSVKEELRCSLGALAARPDLRVMEIGPGTGYLLHRLLSLERRPIFYTGIEHSEGMAEILRERFAKRCAAFTIINRSVTANLLRNDLPGGNFDLIMGSSTLHHLPQYDEVISALASLLAENGILYIVREPIHRDECQPATAFVNLVEGCYAGLNGILMSPVIRRRLWPQKVKAEQSATVGIHALKDGVATTAFLDLERRGFARLFHRKYNRRASAFLSYLENKWLAGIRKDIYGNTLWSWAVQRR